jgi:hypothetical protein
MIETCENREVDSCALEESGKCYTKGHGDNVFSESMSTRENVLGTRDLDR